MSEVCDMLCLFFFFQAEDGIRDVAVTGVQTCALPISSCVGRTITGESLIVSPQCRCWIDLRSANCRHDAGHAGNYNQNKSSFRIDCPVSETRTKQKSARNSLADCREYQAREHCKKDASCAPRQNPKYYCFTFSSQSHSNADLAPPAAHDIGGGTVNPYRRHYQSAERKGAEKKSAQTF